MMDSTRYAIVNNGVVTNVTNVDGDIPDFLRSEGTVVPDFNCQAGPGITWDGTNFINPTVEITDQEAPVAS